ncbi:hypothetical protein PISMIDRAFT_297143 [Pisolithus microcarpus 441]|uniref:Secreted protein n=1 Tax=Pisolithus microcarpus 441 TaxID=765257 RepID=A0A0C9ZWX3_9AGAM|nr:hypothetical protein PISMIDRAFT_297143 [Pisolithus microcarpus 441]
MSVALSPHPLTSLSFCLFLSLSCVRGERDIHRVYLIKSVLDTSSRHLSFAKRYLGSPRRFANYPRLYLASLFLVENDTPPLLVSTSAHTKNCSFRCDDDPHAHGPGSPSAARELLTASVCPPSSQLNPSSSIYIYEHRVVDQQRKNKNRNEKNIKECKDREKRKERMV